MRLNKYLAECGVASRRACDKLIAEGKVSVNGKIVTEMGVSVESTDRILVCGRPVRAQNKKIYLLMHKPKGCVTTVSDELGRKTVMDFVDINVRLYPVGRLDFDTEGALILTNDGDVANKLTHPSKEVEKVYVVRVSGAVEPYQLDALRDGVMLDGKKTAPARVTVLSADAHHTRLEIAIHEGRNRQVRRMLEAVGKEAEFLKRTAIGEIRLGGLARGKYRSLTQMEIEYLKNL